MLKRIVSFLLFWRKSAASAEPIISEIHSAPAFKFDRKAQAQSVETAGQWYYFRDLLDHLDDQVIAVKLLKKWDPQAYNFYKNIGGYIANPKVCWEEDRLDPALMKGGLPTFGLVANQAFTDDKTLYARKLLYFRKAPERVIIEPFDGDVFCVGIAYVKPMAAKSKDLALLWFYVGVDSKGVIKHLRHQATKEHVIHGKRDRTGGKRGRKVQGTWTYTTTEWEKHDLAKFSFMQSLGDTSDEIAKNAFLNVFNITAATSAGLQVRAKRDGVTCVFSIDMLRTPYFFKDRDVVVSQDGKPKKIFHIVRTHQRRLAGGSSTSVRSHFRGLRKFRWNGYTVSIVLPGLHHTPLESFKAEGRVLDDDTIVPHGMYSGKAMAKDLGKYLDA